MEDSTGYQPKPGDIIKPPLNKEKATDLVKHLYGLTTKFVEEMNSYDDRNFHIIAEPSYDNPYIEELCPSGYTLKVANKLDSKSTSFTDSMNEILLLADSKGLNVPIPVKNKSGNYWSLEPMAEEIDLPNLYVVRLLTYLPGKTVCNVPYTPPILFQWGRLLAQFHQAVKGHVDNELLKRKTLWSLYSVPRVMEFVYVIEKEERRHLVEEIVTSFTKEVMNKTKDLPIGIIHGDFNEHNILVQQEGDNFKVTGILDLGDLHIAPVVFDIAIMLTYTMIECDTMDPLEASGHAIAGYMAALPLSDEEQQLLKICISARLCQSLVMGAYTYSLDPSNHYVLSTSRTGWTVLDKLWKTSQEELHKIWQHIIQRY